MSNRITEQPFCQTRVMRMCGGYLAQNSNWNTKRKI